MNTKMTSNLNFHVEPIDLNRSEDWDSLFETYWESWKDPLQVTGVLTFPWIGEGSTLEMDSYNAAKAGYLEMARKNPNQCWLKIEDRSVLGKPRIVGGAAYTAVLEGSLKDSQRPSAFISGSDHDDSLPEIRLPGLGYPDDSERNVLMRQLYSQMWSWHPRIMKDRPHLCK